MTLYTQNAEGFSQATDEQVVAAALKITGKALKRADVLSSPRAVREFLQVRFADLEHEVFVAIFVDTRNRVIATVELFRGTIDGAAVYPREVVKATLQHNAAAVIFAHNHPSGVAEPSEADVHITRRLQDCLALIEVRVLDHVVVAYPECVSFAERGLL